MRFLDWLLPWRRTSRKTVQYEIQRRTHRGGWKNSHKNIYIPEPEDRPTDDDDWWILDPGHYRHVRRVDGQYDEVLWEYKTSDAEEWYEEQRTQVKIEQERERQRQQLRAMSFEEVKAEYFGETNRLDLLGLDELQERYELLRDR